MRGNDGQYLHVIVSISNSNTVISKLGLNIYANREV